MSDKKLEQLLTITMMGDLNKRIDLPLNSRNTSTVSMTLMLQGIGKA